MPKLTGQHFMKINLRAFILPKLMMLLKEVMQLLIGKIAYPP